MAWAPKQNFENQVRAAQQSVAMPRPDRPGVPTYATTYDPLSMSTLPGVEKRLGQLNFDTRGIEAFRNEALRKTPSKWSRLANQQQYVEEMGARERAKEEAASGIAQAEGQLAMRGGLTSGARERLAQQGMGNMLRMSQEVGRQGTLNRLNIGMQDEQQRLSNLKTLPGMEGQLFGANFQKEGLYNAAQQTDLQRQIEENARKNAYEMQKYQEQMKAYDSDMRAWGAEKTAQAQENADSGGSFICTAIKEQGLLSGKELKEMVDLMFSMVPTHAQYCVWYVHNAKKAVEIAKNQNFDFSQIKKEFIDDIIHEKIFNGIEAAKALYIKRSALFCTQFLGECGFKPTMAKPSTIKSLVYLPVLFTMPEVIKLSWGSKRVQKFLLGGA